MEHFAEPEDLGTRTHVAVIRHPLHPMLVNFPIAFLGTVLASDVAYWLSADPFWARMSLWLVGGGTVMGLVAGVTGTVELLAVGRIRRRAASWNHFVAAVMLLSVSTANWGWRIGGPEEAVVPWGMSLSGLGLLLVGISGWLGGALVFEHHVGVIDEEE